MNILFRADASFAIGTGHIMRDLVLATRYPCSKIYFATLNLQGNLNAKIKESGYRVIHLKSNNIDELDMLLKAFDIDVLVIDHYAINSEDEKRLKLQNTKLKILSFDDTYERHYCDILLNHNIYADEKKYKGLVPDFCELRCGVKHLLLRDEFYQVKRLPQIRKGKQVIFLAMGGSDSAHLNISILDVLKAFDHIEVNLVTTYANTNLKELEKYCANKDWITLHVNSNSIAQLMKQSDFGIITPSVTANEAYFMALPFIAIQTADNQEFMVEFLKGKGYCVVQEYTKTKFFKALEGVVK